LLGRGHCAAFLNRERTGGGRSPMANDSGGNALLPEEVGLGADAVALAARSRHPVLSVQLGGTLRPKSNGDHRELRLRDKPQSDLNVINVEVTPEEWYKGKFRTLFETNQDKWIVLQTFDIVHLVAEQRGMTRQRMLETAVGAWFRHALGFRVMEVACSETVASVADNSGGFVLFRVRLEANYEKEVGELKQGEELVKKIRAALIDALPSDLADKSRQGRTSLEQMIQISWTQGGSIELGGLCALSLVMLIVVTIGFGTSRDCICAVCPCITGRWRGTDAEYGSALRELKERGAEFEVNPDGNVLIRVPPVTSAGWKCPNCAIL